MSGTRVLGDWGSTRLRLWRVEGREIAERREGPGMLATRDHAATLLDAMSGWQAERIVLCGMAGARGGLAEAPYAPCPATKDDWARAALRDKVEGIPLTIAAGLETRAADGGPNVMRGEETQIFGALALDPSLAEGRQLVLLPGTHSKWVTLKDGAITGFRTFITGELFGLLGHSSLLGGGSTAEDAGEGFAAGLVRGAEGSSVTSSLFEARSAQLIDGKSAGWASDFVSGVLIGAEIAEMEPPGELAMIAEPALAARYATALAQRGIEAATLDAAKCTIAGLGLLDDD